MRLWICLTTITKMASSTFFGRTGKHANNLIRSLTAASHPPPATGFYRENLHFASFNAPKSPILLSLQDKNSACRLHSSSPLIPPTTRHGSEGPAVVITEFGRSTDNEDIGYVRDADDAGDTSGEDGSAGRMPVATLSSLGAHNTISVRKQQQILRTPVGATITSTRAASNGNGHGSTVTYAIGSKLTMPQVSDDGLHTAFSNGRSAASRQQQNRYNNWEGHDPAIDEAASKQSVRLTPSTILYSGKSTNSVSHLIRSAQYLHRELPIRIAHRVIEFRALPYIVGTNPNIRQVHDLYRKSFYILSAVPRIQTLEDEQTYSKLLLQIMESLRDVVTMLAQGFKETAAYMSHVERSRFLDNMLTSRLGMRILGEHHLALHQAERANFVGLICVNMSVKKVVERWAEFCQELCLHQYGRAPNVKINGHVNATFPYITLPLDYILPELFKNAMRATCEHVEAGEPLPNIVATIAAPKKGLDFKIRISDRGGGISQEALQRVFDYHFTTSTIRTHHRGASSRLDIMPSSSSANNAASPHADDISGMMNDDDPMTDMVALANPSRGPIGGFGFGLPTSRAYAEYLGGGLTVESLSGVGTGKCVANSVFALRNLHEFSSGKMWFLSPALNPDVYLRLKYFDGGAEETFRV